MTVVKLGYERFSQITAKIDADCAVLKGAFCASISGGNGYAKTATATPGIVFLGRAKAASDNTGGAAGADGKDIDLDLEREVFAWKLKNDGTTPFTQATLYGPAYLSAANTVSPSDGLLTSLIARITDIRAKFIAHAPLTAGSVHGSADGATYTIAIPTTAATVYTSCASLKTSALAHVVKVTGGTPIHGAADTAAQGALSALVVPATLEEARLFIEAFAAIMFGSSGHTTRILPDAIHGAADATNVLASSAAAATNPYFGMAWFIDSKTGLVVVEPKKEA
jgi:hypothetical protein